jgi:hypothetical protein
MKTIRIVRGTYGYRVPGSKITTPKGRNAEPFEVSDEEAARLVKLGVAAVVDDFTATEVKTPADVPVKPSGGNTGVGATLTLAQLRRLNVDTHQALAVRLGIDLSSATNKDGRADLIWAALEQRHATIVIAENNEYEIVDDDDESVTDDDDADDVEDDDEDGETPPNPGADVPVE